MGSQLGAQVVSWLTLHAFTDGDEVCVNLQGVSLVCVCPAGGTSTHFNFGGMMQVRETLAQIKPFMAPAEPIPAGIIPS